MAEGNQHDGVFSHVNEKKWKYLSIGLMGILATGLLAPQAYADSLSTIQSIVTDIQSKVNNSTYGLQAIKNAINGVQSTVNSIKTDTQIIRGDLFTFKTDAESKLDAKISSRASQTSVDNLQTTVNNLPKASSSIVRISKVINDGADNLYNGDVTFHRSQGTGAYQIEQLYVCGIDAGPDTVKITYQGNMDGRHVERLSGTIPGDQSHFGCQDLLDVWLTQPAGANRFLLGGDETHDVSVHLSEAFDTGNVDDSDGAEIVAFVTGLNSAADLSISSTTDAA